MAAIPQNHPTGQPAAFVPYEPARRRLGELAALPNVYRFQAANMAYAAAFDFGNAPIRIQGAYYVQGAA